MRDCGSRARCTPRPGGRRREQVGEAFDVEPARADAHRQRRARHELERAEEEREDRVVDGDELAGLDDRLECEREAVEAAVRDHDALGREALARGDPLPQQRDALGPGVLQRRHPRLGEHAGAASASSRVGSAPGSGTPESRRIASGWRGRRTAAPNPIGALSPATSAVRRGAAASPSMRSTSEPPRARSRPALSPSRS